MLNLEFKNSINPTAEEFKALLLSISWVNAEQYDLSESCELHNKSEKLIVFSKAPE